MIKKVSAYKFHPDSAISFPNTRVTSWYFFGVLIWRVTSTECLLTPTETKDQKYNNYLSKIKAGGRPYSPSSITQEQYIEIKNILDARGNVPEGYYRSLESRIEWKTGEA